MPPKVKNKDKKKSAIPVLEGTVQRTIQLTPVRQRKVTQNVEYKLPPPLHDYNLRDRAKRRAQALAEFRDACNLPVGDRLMDQNAAGNIAGNGQNANAPNAIAQPAVQQQPQPGQQQQPANRQPR
jgi:hypothetical protein